MCGLAYKSGHRASAEKNQFRIRPSIMCHPRRLMCVLLLLTVVNHRHPPIPVTLAHPNSTAVAVAVTLPLIHRDSPLSPFYNPSATPTERLHLAALRSATRRSQLGTRRRRRRISSPMLTAGSYVIPFALGTPPHISFALPDTGSDLVWTQCVPCRHCNHDPLPLFDPSKSSTYRPIPCNAAPCRGLPFYGCAKSIGQCGYYYFYGDGTEAFGLLARETVSLVSASGRTWPFKNIVIGCTRFDAGLFSAAGSSIIGLGTGPTSLISQLGKRIDHRFSHCIVPGTANASGTISFGGRPIAAAGAVSTPLFLGDNYYVVLESVAVGGRVTVRVPRPRAGSGNVIVDSGTVLPSLDVRTARAVNAAAEKVFPPGLRRVSPPAGGRYSFCYEGKKARAMKLPGMVLGLRGGAKLRLRGEKLYVFDALGEGVEGFCMSIVAEEPAILGSMAMENLRVEYDLGRKVVTFAPARCAVDVRVA